MDDGVEIRLALLFVALALFFGALLGPLSRAVDNPITDHELCQFQVGTTTAAQVLSALGTPESILRVDDGQELLYERPAWAGRERYVFSFQRSAFTALTITAPGAEGGEEQDGKDERPVWERRMAAAARVHKRTLPACIAAAPASPSAPAAPAFMGPVQ